MEIDVQPIMSGRSWESKYESCLKLPTTDDDISWAVQFQNRLFLELGVLRYTNLESHLPFDVYQPHTVKAWISSALRLMDLVGACAAAVCDTMRMLGFGSCIHDIVDSWTRIS